MSKIFKNEIFDKQNLLNEIRVSTRNMGLPELRFFSIYLSKIKPKNLETHLVRFSLDDFQKDMEFGRLNTSFLKEIMNKLLQKTVCIFNEEDSVSFQLFKKCEFFQDEYGEKYIEIDAHDKAFKLLLDYKKKYFKYKIKNILKLKSVNQFRLYELLKQYENIGNMLITVKDLKEILDIAPDEYTRMNNFKKKVLDICQKAFVENTDICFTYEKGKGSGKGGKWISILFHITKNENDNENDEDDEDIISQLYTL